MTSCQHLTILIRVWPGRTFSVMISHSCSEAFRGWGPGWLRLATDRNCAQAACLSYLLTEAHRMLNNIRSRCLKQMDSCCTLRLALQFALRSLDGCRNGHKWHSRGVGPSVELCDRNNATPVSNTVRILA
jgi:hypothetical protein